MTSMYIKQIIFLYCFFYFLLKIIHRGKKNFKTVSFRYFALSLKCKISAIWLVEKACMYLIFLIATVQMSMECNTQESSAGSTKHLNLYWPKTYVCECRLRQNLIVLNLYCVSVNKILVTEIYYCEKFTDSKLDIKYVNTVKSTIYKVRVLKVIECLEQNIQKQIDYKIPSSTKQMNIVQTLEL